MTPDLSVVLAAKAKELMSGMRDRVGRDPDVADFAAAFAPLLSRKNILITKEQVRYILDHIYFDDALGRGEAGTRRGAVLRNYLMPGWLDSVAEEFAKQLNALLG